MATKGSGILLLMIGVTAACTKGAASEPDAAPPSLVAATSSRSASLEPWDAIDQGFKGCEGG